MDRKQKDLFFEVFNETLELYKGYKLDLGSNQGRLLRSLFLIWDSICDIALNNQYKFIPACILLRSALDYFLWFKYIVICPDGEGEFNYNSFIEFKKYPKFKELKMEEIPSFKGASIVEKKRKIQNVARLVDENLLYDGIFRLTSSISHPSRMGLVYATKDSQGKVLHVATELMFKALIVAYGIDSVETNKICNELVPKLKESLGEAC